MSAASGLSSYARPTGPVCMYCWKPLVRFRPSSNYKGPASEWTHFVGWNAGRPASMSVLCKSNQHGPRVPRMIPGSLIIREIETMLSTDA